jgi:D-tagatose-1,6-bisphosphate aldolase subunit GatZ/KbaZ
VTAVNALFTNLQTVDVPLPLLSAHLPNQYARVRAGVLEATPVALTVDYVRDILRTYARACTPIA